MIGGRAPTKKACGRLVGFVSTVPSRSSIVRRTSSRMPHEFRENTSRRGCGLLVVRFTNNVVVSADF